MNLEKQADFVATVTGTAQGNGFLEPAASLQPANENHDTPGSTEES